MIVVECNPDELLVKKLIPEITKTSTLMQEIKQKSLKD